MENKVQHSVLVGHQAKLLKALCRLVLAYIKYKTTSLGNVKNDFIELEKRVEIMEKLLNGN